MQKKSGERIDVFGKLKLAVQQAELAYVLVYRVGLLIKTKVPAKVVAFVAAIMLSVAERNFNKAHNSVRQLLSMNNPGASFIERRRTRRPNVWNEVEHIDELIHMLAEYTGRLKDSANGNLHPKRAQGKKRDDLMAESAKAIRSLRRCAKELFSKARLNGTTRRKAT